MTMRSLSADNPVRAVWKAVAKVKDHRASGVPLSKALTMLMRQAAQRRQLYGLAKCVLPRYALKADSIRFVSSSVNTVFQVEAEGAKYALRIHPISGCTTERIQAEFLWLLALGSDTPLAVPKPVPATDGTLVQKVSSPRMSQPRQISLLRWLEGKSISHDLSPSTMEQVGSFMAQLHRHGEQFKAPDGISRQHVKWEELWPWQEEDCLESKVLAPDDCKLAVTTARAVLRKTGTFPRDVDYGLVHLDLHPWNLLLHRGTVGAIDFDSCQYAPFLYDMAIPLTYLGDRQDYESLKTGFLRGYAHERPLPLDHEAGLEFFMVVRALDMITWVLSWPSPARERFGPDTLASSLARLGRYDVH